MLDNSSESDLRLIEAGFPCHQVGAETQRERGASSALPPLYYLHIWWARRPLTPSRAAILASLLPADTDPDWFLRQLGIEKRVVEINGQEWTLDPKDHPLWARAEAKPEKGEFLQVDTLVLDRLEKENTRRKSNRQRIEEMVQKDPNLENDLVLVRWRFENDPLPEPWPKEGANLKISRVSADPAFGQARIELEKKCKIHTQEDVYGYGRAFTQSQVAKSNSGLTVLDPTAGGGSIPFEALRLGHKVIANDLNPVASVILHATLDFPFRFGPELSNDIRKWGRKIQEKIDLELSTFFPDQQKLCSPEKKKLKEHLGLKNEHILSSYNNEYIKDYLYCRQITCPHCKGTAPLLNSCWLSKTGQQWGVSIVPDSRGREVRFETYHAKNGKGPKGENPEFATVVMGLGACIHCKQAISGDEIKRQARGESEHGKWTDRLFCVVAVRYQPKLDKKGQLQFYKSGERKGEIKTEKVTFFRPPNETDLAALKAAEKRLQEKWDAWDAAGLIPTESIPAKSNYNRGHRLYGIMRWCDMFTPRQLLGHLTLVEALNSAVEKMRLEMDEDRVRAVATYLQFMIDKGLDYNSKQTRWHYNRGVLINTFGRHNFALTWTFGEMIFSGPQSGFDWSMSQIIDAYQGLTSLMPKKEIDTVGNLQIYQENAGYLAKIESATIDLVCMDPPYYDNVLYAELSDFFYVWNRRTLQTFYPQLFRRRLVNKEDEAVSNIARDGSSKKAKENYEAKMSDIFAECRRIIKNKGLLTLMFTHKSQEAWEIFTRSLINTGWIISATFPVESEGKHSIHQMQTASAASSIFITCRKRLKESTEPAPWLGFGGTGVQRKIATAVAEALPDFERLGLNPVDKMVASYGRALRILSENWPVIDGNDAVSPARAMNEASRIVSEREIARITNGNLKVTDLSAEAAMALTIYGMYGLNEFPYDEGLNLSRSLNIRLKESPAGYTPAAGMIGINIDAPPSGTTRQQAERVGFHAPLLRKGSKLRLAHPKERHQSKLEEPNTEWDALCGIIMAHERGDIPVARAYLQEHEAYAKHLLDLLEVWTAETDDENLVRQGRAMLFSLKK